MKKLIVNADDFGFCPSVSAGILDAYRKKVVTDFSFMIKDETFSASFELLKKEQIHSCGVHLNVTSGRSVRTGKTFPGLKGLIREISLNRQARVEVRKEMESQLLLINQSGIQITHIDSHQNFHVLPFFLDSIYHLCQSLGLSVPIRIPLELPGSGSSGNMLRLAVLSGISLLNGKKRSRQKVKVVGQNYYNNPDRDKVLKDICHTVLKSRNEFCEFPLHPGYCDTVCNGACRDTYTMQRPLELESILKNSGIFALNNIKKVSFADIPSAASDSIHT